MISLLLSFAALVTGYLFYGKAVEKVFAPDDRKTPAFEKQDGVDFIPKPTWKAFLVRLLNIAGTGPIFGALPAAFMSAVSLTYILMAPEGFRLQAYVAYPAGAVFAAVLFAIYLSVRRKAKVESK